MQVFPSETPLQPFRKTLRLRADKTRGGAASFHVAHGDVPSKIWPLLRRLQDQQSAIVGAIVRHLVSLETLHLKDLAVFKEKNEHGIDMVSLVE